MMANASYGPDFKELQRMKYFMASNPSLSDSIRIRIQQGSYLDPVGFTSCALLFALMAIVLALFALGSSHQEGPDVGSSVAVK